MFLSDRTKEKQLFAFSPRDLVSEDSDVWMYEDIFDQLDLEKFYQAYSAQGQESVDPRLMLRTIFYGLTHGVQSGRKLEMACQSDVRYMVLSGGYKPHFRTFHRFLNRHMRQMEEVFVATVRLAQKMDLVNLGRVAIDGTRLRGYTSHTHSVRYGKAEKTIAYIQESLKELKNKVDQENASDENNNETLPKEIKRKEERIARIQAAKKIMEKERKTDPESQRSLSDLEARPMGGRKAPFMFGYNGQVAVDEKSHVIVAADAFQGTNDSAFLTDVVDQTIANVEDIPKEVLVDSGYQSAENIKMLEEKGVVPYFGLKKTNENPAKSGGNFELYTQITATDDGRILCPAGKELPVKGVGPNKPGRLTMKRGFCTGCPLKKTCQLFRKRNIKSIRLSSLSRQAAIRKIYRRSESTEYKEIYRKRQGIVESTFGNIKYNKSLRIYLRGLKNIKSWWKLVCAAMNVEIMVRRKAVFS